MATPSPHCADITAGSAVKLLPGGWQELEFDAVRTLRRVENHAAFSLPAGINPCAHVEVELEGIRSREFLLRVRGDADEHCVSVRDRQMLTLALPLQLKSESRYTLNADGGFRVFRLANRADIVTLQSGVELLEGWEAMTEEDGERRRVARTGAKLRLHSLRDFPVLAADVDAGPAPAVAGLRIDLCDEGGETLFTTGIRQRQVAQMRLAIAAGSSGLFSLHYDWIGRPAAAPPVLRAYRFVLT